MFVILFRSRLTPEAGADFEEAGDRMLEVAKAIPNSGFVDMRSYTASDGERMSVVWWRDLETLDLWRKDLGHRAVKKAGRERWYSFFDVEVAEVLRGSHFAGLAPDGRSASEDVVVAASPSTVFAFLADLDNLSRWVTVKPDVHVTVSADAAARTVEWTLWFPNGVESRVRASVSDGSLVSVTKTQLPGESDAAFSSRLANLRAELVALQSLWS